MDKVLENCQTAVDQYPDSISRFLDSVYSIGHLSSKQQKKYLLIKIQAKDLLMQNISQDTSIYSVKRYYREKDDFKNLALASYYCGRVKEENDRNTEAMSDYLEAEEYTATINDRDLCGMIQLSIGSILSKQSRYSEATEQYLKSIGYFTDSSNKKYLFKTYHLLADTYLLKPDADSAIYFYQKGLELARLSNDSLHMADFMQNIGIAYKHTGDFRKAINSFSSSCKFQTNPTDKARLYLNLAEILSDIHKQDSALYAIGRSLKCQQQTGDLNLLSDIYKTLSDIESKNSNHYQSMFFHQTYRQYLELHHNEQNNRELADLQGKYNTEQTINKKQDAKLVIYTICLVISISLLVTAGVIFYFYYKSVGHQKVI